MKVTFPHMGNMYIPIKGLLDYLNVDVVMPPFTSKKTLSLGTRIAPEFACLPMKINLGNFMEAREMGADTILMAGGVGPCRFGYYAQVQREILTDLGYHFNMVVIEPPEKNLSELIREIKKITGNASLWKVIKAMRFAWYKAKAVDDVETFVHKIRPREISLGSADRAYEKALDEIHKAKNKEDIFKAVLEAEEQFNNIPIDHNKEVIKIGIVGEIYTLLDYFSNIDLEKNLGKLGVEVERSLYLSQWINEHLFLGLIRSVKSSKTARKAAKPYINYFVGGHGQDSVGNSVLFARDRYDGVIQIAPFTCMPEIVAESVLPTVSKDFGIPIFSLVVDEHSGEAGIMTRLEAFVDLLQRKKDMELNEEVKIG